MDKIDELLEANMTDVSFRMWKALKEKIPDIRYRPSSSSGKYHRRNGTVLSIYDHTYEMLVCCTKLFSIFNVEVKTKRADILLLSILFHDAFKYGIENPFSAQHTDRTHDRLVANIINDNKSFFMRVFTEEEVNLLEQCLRYHSGRWSSDAGPDFTFSKISAEALFIHILDMMSTHNLLAVGESSNVNEHQVSP